MADYGARPMYIKFDGYSNSLGNMYAVDTYLAMNSMDLFTDFFSGKLDKFLTLISEEGYDYFFGFKLDASATSISPSGGTGVYLYRSNIVIDGYTMYYPVT